MAHARVAGRTASRDGSSRSCGIAGHRAERSSLTFAARVGPDGERTEHFNGRIASPTLLEGALDDDGPRAAGRGRPPSRQRRCRDRRGLGLRTRDPDRPPRRHGPQRPPRPDSQPADPRRHRSHVARPPPRLDAPGATGYGAIHFHDDDLEDAGWEPDFEVAHAARSPERHLRRAPDELRPDPPGRGPRPVLRPRAPRASDQPAPLPPVDEHASRVRQLARPGVGGAGGRARLPQALPAPARAALCDRKRAAQPLRPPLRRLGRLLLEPAAAHRQHAPEDERPAGRRRHRLRPRAQGRPPGRRLARGQRARTSTSRPTRTSTGTASSASRRTASS